MPDGTSTDAAAMVSVCTPEVLVPHRSQKRLFREVAEG
jgi:hypothetical protein